MVNKALRIVLYSIFTISLLFVVPFNNIYADSYVSPSYVDNTQRDKWQNAGGNVVNFSEDPLTGSTPSKLTFTFNDNYYGFVSFQPYSGNSVWNDSTVFIAGGVGYYNYRNSSSFNPKYIDGVKITYVNLFLPDSNVDLSQIISILTAIENDTTALDTTTDAILIDLQSVLNEIIDSNGYLEILTKIRQWNIPFESFGFVHYLMSNNYQIFDYSTYNYYYFPIFKLQQNDLLMSVYIRNGRTFRFILGVNAYWTSESNIRSALNVPNTLTIENISTIDTVYSKSITGYGSYLNIVKFDLSNKSGSGVDYKAYVNNAQYQNTLIVPIYANFINNNVSTDFALRFGLSNTLLDNIQLIANGTNASSAASSQSDQANTQLQQDSNTLFTQEDSFKQNMNSAMQNIDTTFSLNNFGSSFMTSAQWVRTQYETLTNNTPFASLITFSLLVGLALIVIGKVYK